MWSRSLVRKEHTFYYKDGRGVIQGMRDTKTEIIAMVSGISDSRKLELIHRFLVRILQK